MAEICSSVWMPNTLFIDAPHYFPLLYLWTLKLILYLRYSEQYCTKLGHFLLDLPCNILSYCLSVNKLISQDDELTLETEPIVSYMLEQSCIPIMKTFKM